MGTVKTAIDNARIKIRDSGKLLFASNDPLVDILNEIIEELYQLLCQIESNLVYGIGTVTTVDETAEYTPSFEFDGFLPEGSWVDDYAQYLYQVPETDKLKWGYPETTEGFPECFYVTEDNKVGYLGIPDDEYTVTHTYWKPLTALTDYDTDDLPFSGIWNNVIMRRLVIELLEIQERDVSRHAILLEINHNKALSATFSRGCRQRQQVSNFFISGV